MGLAGENSCSPWDVRGPGPGGLRIPAGTGEDLPGLLAGGPDGPQPSGSWVMPVGRPPRPGRGDHTRICTSPEKTVGGSTTCRDSRATSGLPLPPVSRIDEEHGCCASICRVSSP